MNASFSVNRIFPSRVGNCCKRALVLALLMLSSSTAFAIKKCQDAEGKWHYGDTAVDECERSKVTTLDSRGFIRDQNEAPKTEEEIAAEQASRAKEIAEEKRIEDEREERNRLLSVYQSEADIDRQLANQIYSVESNIAVHNVYLKGMNQQVERLQEKKSKQSEKFAKETQIEIDETLRKIKDSEDELKNLAAQKQQIHLRFEREKKLFRSIKAENEG